MIIEELAEPIKHEDDGIAVELTHRGWGHTFQSWNPPVLSYSVLGRLRADGTFKPQPGTEEYAPFSDADLTALLAPNKDGKQQDVFRNTDIIDLHEAIVARKAAAVAEQTAASRSAAASSNG